MTLQFALTWAYTWLAGFGLFSIIGILMRMPLPNEAACLSLGAAVGAWITWPIILLAFTRS